MNKKYLGLILSSIGCVGMSLLYSVSKVYSIVSYYDISIFKLMLQQFFCPLIVIASIIIYGIYTLLIGMYEDFDINKK